MTDTTLRTIEMRPGIISDLTKYTAEGGFVDCDHIRWRNGRPEKIGGWVREVVQQNTDDTNDLFTGVSRDALSWSSLESKKYLAVATHQKVELLSDGIIHDITPIREAVSLEDAISTTSGESVVEIVDVNHNLQEGDYIVVTLQDAPVDGITLSGEYVVLEVIDADTYTIDSGVIASGTTASAGDTLEIDYLLDNGEVSNGNLTGYSGGTWGTEGEAGQGYNRPRSGIGGSSLRQWSLENWGEDLLACVRGGKIYHWDEDNGVTGRLEALTGTDVPETNLFILVSQPSRHLIAFGSEVFATGDFDPLVIRWASQESLTDWEITSLNTAGEYRLPKGNYIVGAVQTRSEIVIFTNTEVYSMRYVGGNDVFQITPLGTNISAISQNSFIDVNGVVYWMGLDNFYVYDGVVRSLPTTINKYLFDQDGAGRINFSQKEKVYVGIDKEFNEILWFYPTFDEEENGHYIKYNTLENLWDYGTMDRTVWVDKSVFEKPYALNSSGRLFSHEVGKDDDGQALEAFITTAYFDIDDGENIMYVDRIVPDIRLADNRNINISVFAKKYPHPRAAIQTKGPFIFDDTKNKISCRVRGRQMALEFRVTSTGSDFELGKIRLGFQKDGER